MYQFTVVFLISFIYLKRRDGMAEYLLGIDYGTGGAKACIIDEAANILSYAYREYPIIVNKPGWSEHDPRLYWEIACQIIAECLAKGAVDPARIKAIGTSSALPCLVMVDKRHEPVQLAYNLMDRRAVKEVEWLRETVGEERIFDITGNRLEDHPSIVNLLWEKNNRPESFGNIYKALTIDGYIRLKLTGQATVNIPNAAFYGVAYNIREHRFEEDILSAIGICKEILPEIYDCETVIGEVTPEAARKTGLIQGTAVIAGTADAPAGWMGAGAVEEGDTQMNLGTCGNFGVIHRDTDFLKTMLVCAHAVDCRRLFVTIPTTTTGGQSIRYLRDNFSHTEIGMEKLIGISSYELLDMEAERVRPGSEGLVILPYLMGERTPIWDINARGVIFGLSLNHGKGHIVRAMMESVAYALYDSFLIIKETGKKINYPIVLNEGGAASKIWRKIITDVFNVPTTVVKSRAGAPYGDAVQAGVSAGIFKGYAFTKEKAEYVDLIEPDKNNHELYMEYFRIYRNLYKHVREDFKELAGLRSRY